MPSIFPLAPPTASAMDPNQRIRLLKSTRKLGAILGATPRVLELDGTSSTDPRAPYLRQEDRIFTNDSAISSDSSLCSSSDREHSSVRYSDKPKTLSEQIKEGKHHKSISASLPPTIPIMLHLPFGRKSCDNGKIKPKKTLAYANKVLSADPSFAPQTQPLLYRLPSNSSVPILPASVPPLPHSCSFETDNNFVNDGLEMTPKTRAATENEESSDAHRRRKLAKLARTLGETVPPELVFGPRSDRVMPSLPVPTANHEVSSDLRNNVARKAVLPPITAPPRFASLPVDDGNKQRVHVNPTSGKYSAEGDLVRVDIQREVVKEDELPKPNNATASRIPPSFHATAVVASTTQTVAGSCAANSTLSNANPSVVKPTRRKHRPRSLTLTHIPHTHSDIIIEQTMGNIASSSRMNSRSLDQSRPSIEVNDHKELPLRNRSIFPISSKLGKAMNKSTTHVALGSSGGNHSMNVSTRRKEKEWSGEWNVQDAEDLLKKLRSLK